MKRIDKYHKNQPWQRLSHETDLAYSYFVSYMVMGGKRSLPKVVQKHSKKEHYLSQLKKWSSTYNWVERVKAYDEDLIKRSIKRRNEIVEKAHARLLNILNDALDVYEHIIKMDSTMHVEDGHKTFLIDRFRAAKDVLDRVGINFSEYESMSNKNELSTYDKINQYYHGKRRHNE